MERKAISVILILMMVATAIADLGFMHALNNSWPPHARFHAIWNVLHVFGTHSIALGLLWIGPLAGQAVAIRIACLIVTVFIVSFFAAGLLSGPFDASVHPDLPIEEMPPTLFGLDGNMIGFMFVLPIVLWIWWRSERRAEDV